MKAEGVNDWLKHWLRMQQKKKRPLILKNPSEAPSDQSKAPAKSSKGKGKAKALSPPSSDEVSDEEDVDSQKDFDNEEDEISNPAKSVNGASTPTVAKDNGDTPQAGSSLPLTPASAAKSKETRLLFLKSLSDDKYYRQLLRLLYAAKVSKYSEQYFYTACIDLNLAWTAYWHTWARLGQLELQKSFPSTGIPQGQRAGIAFPAQDVASF